MSYFRPNIDELAAYVPGEQPAPGTRVIKLNTNENPYPPSPAALKVLHDLDADALRRYPDPMATAVCRAAGAVCGLEADWVLAGNGSDDLLTMIMRACADDNRSVAYPMPTYVLYRTLAQIQDARCIEVDFDDDYNLPVEALAAAQAAVTLVAMPNSPSGTVWPLEMLDDLAGRLTGMLVIDEAYADFAESNALSLVASRPNVIVLRTLSKGYSLAGLRLGFGLANPDLLAGLVKVKDSYNVDAVACRVAAAALADQDHKNANARKVIASRQRLVGALTELGFAVWPSQSNFLLARPPGGQAQALYQALKARGILVRYFKQARLDDKLRITVGTDDENDALTAAIRELLP
ncbi:MAG: Histidinol-phosphate aminotransferase [Planctomycetes bacterium ADurb.Bin126]|nr:MAG: Histidinol-phosphate aminotransferase [Planctomycetes bacterium ADurb.Bin126]HOD81305.1 histidinol-phosphate transaminase [Phycisphaerae bacterium]HQL74118.1 histidinol-phosphate transaminase [Phycisphaerae bacterium]